MRLGLLLIATAIAATACDGANTATAPPQPQPNTPTATVGSCPGLQAAEVRSLQRLAATNNRADYPAAQDDAEAATTARVSAGCPAPTVRTVPTAEPTIKAEGCQQVPTALVDFLAHAVDPSARAQDLELHDAAAVVSSAVGVAGGRPTRYYFVAAAGIDPVRGEPGVGVWAVPALVGQYDGILGVTGTLTEAPGGSLFPPAYGTDADYEKNAPDADRALACAGHASGP